MIDEALRRRCSEQLAAMSERKSAIYPINDAGMDFDL